MTTYFVSNAGSNTAPYDTEAKAATSILTIQALPWTSADTVKVSSTHTQTANAVITLTCPTTPGLKILSVTFNGSGTGGLAAGGAINVGAANSSFSIITGFVYIYGLTMAGGTNNSASANLCVGSNLSGTGGTLATGIILDSCTLSVPTANTGAGMFIGTSGNATDDDMEIRLINCTMSHGAAHATQLQYGTLLFSGLSFTGTAPTTIFNSANGICLNATIVASDLSGVAWTNLFLVSQASTGLLRLVQCELRSSFTLTTGSFVGPGATELELIDCHSGDVNYYYAKSSWEGTILADNAVFYDASDGSDSISWLMTGNANSSFQWPLTSPPISFFNSTLSSMTTTVEVINDGTTFKDNELWQETLAKITSGAPLGTWNIGDRAADILNAGTNQDTSSVTWGAGPGGSEVKQKLVSGSFTPAETGAIQVVVKLAKNDSVYVSPKVLSGSGKQWMSGGGIYMNEQAATGGGLLRHPGMAGGLNA